MTCFACEREPTLQCNRCGRPYCDEHGEEFCDACLEPASGVPSFTLYRGSLLALLIGTGLAVWLLVQPTGGESGGLRPQVVTPTSVAQIAPTQPPGQQPAGQPTTAPVQATTAPAGSATPRPTNTAAAPANTREYTVASGDTVSSICESTKPSSMTLSDCIDRVRTLNDLTDDEISVGDKLIIPA